MDKFTGADIGLIFYRKKEPDHIMNKVLFLYLKAFTKTGGIEKFNRSMMKALHELSVDGFIDGDSISSHDIMTDEKYFPLRRFTGFGGSKLRFTIYTIFKAISYDTVLVGHINLSILGIVIKLIRPSSKIILITHGIEVWKEHKGIKKMLLEKADLILAVSDFTRRKICEFNPSININSIRIFPNTIDPYFSLPDSFDKPEYLLKRYGIDKKTPIILTITRLSFSEKYKGYDNIIKSVSDLAMINEGLVYLLCGKADDEEKTRIETLINEAGCSENVRLTGYINDSELIDHYLLADVFVMQSKKEGFGIVFVEALACGRKVIAGSKDGSREALLDGKLGVLIDPDSESELKTAVNKLLRIDFHSPKEQQKTIFEAFNFGSYKERLKFYLNN